MATYIMLTTLTDEGRKTVKANPGRIREVNKEIESLGAKVIAQYAVLGLYDFVNVIEAPDNVAAAAFSVGIASGGSLRSAETTVLFTVEETIEMLEKAQGLPYRPPGASS